MDTLVNTLRPTNHTQAKGLLMIVGIWLAIFTAATVFCFATGKIPLGIFTTAMAAVLAFSGREGITAVKQGRFK